MDERREGRSIAVNDIYLPALSIDDRYLFLFGGKGSGKSDVGVFKKLLRLQSNEKHKFLFIRKVKDTIKESLFALTKEIVSRDFDNYDDWKFNETDKSVVYIPNGNRIIMSGVDDREKLKSLAGITGILVEEITELSEEDFNELDSRLRGQTDGYKQIISMFNPIDEDHWVKDYVEPEDVEFERLKDGNIMLLLESMGLKGKALKDTFENISSNKDCIWRFSEMNSKGNSVYTSVFNTTYAHNYFIGDEYEAVLDKQGKKSHNALVVNKLGRWGKKSVDNPAWWGFDEEKIVVDEHLFSPDKSIHCTFDQNLHPYFTQVCFHLTNLGFKNGVNRYRCEVFDEFCTPPPRNRAIENAKAFKEKYPKESTKANLYYYGDSSLNVGSTLAKKGVTGFSIIRNEYEAYINPNSNRTQKSNPPLSLSVKFLNYLLAGEVMAGLQVEFLISNTCVKLIEDLKFQKEGADGKPLKEKMKIGGVTCEKYGHAIDSFRYAIVKAFEDHWKRFSNPKSNKNIMQWANT